MKLTVGVAVTPSAKALSESSTVDTTTVYGLKLASASSSNVTHKAWVVQLLGVGVKLLIRSSII